MFSLCQVWQHFDDGSCPGQGIGVRARLENGLSGFIHTKNLSDSQVNAPEERVHVSHHLLQGSDIHVSACDDSYLHVRTYVKVSTRARVSHACVC